MLLFVIAGKQKTQMSMCEMLFQTLFNVFTSTVSYPLIFVACNCIFENSLSFNYCRALQIPPEAWLRMSLYHGSITWITIRPNGRVALKSLGDAGFMPAGKLTTS